MMRGRYSRGTQHRHQVPGQQVTGIMSNHYPHRSSAVFFNGRVLTPARHSWTTRMYPASTSTTTLADRLRRSRGSCGCWQRVAKSKKDPVRPRETKTTCFLGCTTSAICLSKTSVRATRCLYRVAASTRYEYWLAIQVGKRRRRRQQQRVPPTNASTCPDSLRECNMQRGQECHWWLSGVATG